MAFKSFSFKVAGAAGEGIMSTGLLFSKTAAKSGLFIFDYTEYPSLITGGHNTYQVRISPDPVYCQSSKTDILLALNTDSLKIHHEELNPESVVIYDGQTIKTPIEEFKIPAKTLDLPMAKLALDAGGKELISNNVGFGAAAYLAGFDLTVVNQIISEVFEGKDQAVIATDLKAAAAGFNFAKGKFPTPILQNPVGSQPKITMSGNEAVALGAIAGGLQFYAAYPMTPSSSILHYMAKNASKTGIVVKHAEDEISVVNMAIGASFAGVRAMVGTSGGGFCYMTEGLGLAGITELPLVVFLGQRSGPALGLPTWSEQGDLKFALSAGNGEFPRVLLAPSDAKEAFELTRRALTLAESFQTPVIILSDKYLAESRYPVIFESETFTNSRFGFETNPKPDENGFYPRYKADSAVSLRTVPGMAGGVYIANADEHDHYGLTTEESALRIEQVNKRNKKLEEIKLEIPLQYWQEEKDAKLTFISFGSTKGPVTEARIRLLAENIPTNHLNLSWLWPFPKDQVMKVIMANQNVLVVEANSQGQLADLIAQETGYISKSNLNRYDGRPFYPEDLIKYVLEKVQ